MNIKKSKNGFIIEVKKWSNLVTITELATGLITITQFSDHIRAVQVAKMLIRNK